MGIIPNNNNNSGVHFAGPLLYFYLVWYMVLLNQAELHEHPNYNFVCFKGIHAGIIKFITENSSHKRI